PFVYWRGNGGELDELGPQYLWRAPDGSAVRAWQLPEGYFSAGGPGADGGIAATADPGGPVGGRLLKAGGGPRPPLDRIRSHSPADASTTQVAARVGARRMLLDEAATYLAPADALTPWAGALVGGRATNLLPGVWSARMPLKLRNRAVETLLTAWTEPWMAFG